MLIDSSDVLTYFHYIITMFVLLKTIIEEIGSNRMTCGACNKQNLFGKNEGKRPVWRTKYRATNYFNKLDMKE